MNEREEAIEIVEGVDFPLEQEVYDEYVKLIEEALIKAREEEAEAWKTGNRSISEALRQEREKAIEECAKKAEKGILSLSGKLLNMNWDKLDEFILEVRKSIADAIIALKER